MHKLNFLNPLIANPLPLPPTLRLVVNRVNPPDPPPYPNTNASVFEEISRQEAIEFLLRNHSLSVGEHYEEDPKKLLWRYYRRKSSKEDHNFVDSTPEPACLPAEWDIWSKVRKQCLGSKWDQGVILPSGFAQHGGLQKAHRGRLITWLCDPRRWSNVFFVELEPRTLIDMSRDLVTICESTNRLGATYGGDSVPNARFAALFIALQLAARCPPYRMIVADLLVNHWEEIVKQDVAKQFDELVVQPWENLSSSHPHYLKMPLVIVLGHLGGLQSSEDELSLLKIITAQYARLKSTPLLFVIVSRHLMAYPFYTMWEYVQIPGWYPDKRKDMENSLRFELEANRKTHPHFFQDNEIWPAEEDVIQLACAASGSLDLCDAVSAMIQYTGNTSPKQQLKRILSYVSQIPDPTPSEPNLALHHFYSQFLSNIPGPLRQNTLCLMSLITHRTEVPPGIMPDRFLLHVLGINTPSLLYNIHWILHANFWVRDPFVSFMTESRNHREPAAWISKSTYFISSFHILHNSAPASRLLNALKWSPTTPLEVVSEAFFHPQYALIRFCRGLDYIVRHETCEDQVIKELRQFDFRTLAHICSRVYPIMFCDMLRALYVVHDLLPDIIRTEPLVPKDKLFIKKCRAIVPPLNMESLMDGLWRGQTLGYALVGYGDNTVLVILHDDEARGKVPNEQGYVSITRDAVVTIYTSGMLDDI